MPFDFAPYNRRTARQRQLDAAWRVIDLASRAVVLSGAAVLVWCALEPWL